MSGTSTSRRGVLLGGAAFAAWALAACAGVEPHAAAQVVVVGGGFGGATAAKYLRLWSEGRIGVTLVEPNRSFVSCPLSNLVLGGSLTLAELTQGYDGLRRHGVRVVHDSAVAVDAQRRTLRLAGGGELAWDRLVVSPGIELTFDRIAGMSEALAERFPHAWKAGAQTALLRRQLESMPDGGVVLIGVPPAPYRCPPGPYERACQIAGYLKQHKPRSKLIVLDANPQVVSKGALFTRVWQEDFAGMIEHRANSAVAAIDASAQTVTLELGERVRGDVINLIPPMRAGAFARSAGLANAGDRWCAVDWRTLESTALPGVHVLGDATLAAPGMPKSGHMANQHGKAVAAALVERLLHQREPSPPVMNNTCYSFVDDRRAIHVASVHRWVEAKKTLEPFAGAGGVSPAQRELWLQEARYAFGWARSIWQDMLA
jgi:NADPH-dependent 2,4-dienoyl-CoA reductase/sulfur reductase-like enzyme